MADKPTDEEIIMLAVELGVSVRTGKGAVKLTRAVLAKWGSPVVAGEPEGWITWWPTAAGVRDPIYSHGPKQPGYGAELDAVLRKYPVCAAPVAPSTPASPTIEGESNV